MLQPDGMQIGLDGVFAPLAVARLGPCDPECSACGHACPTGAIKALPEEERQAAKMGTAVITPNKCLAWEVDRACLVCDEACPYGAISLKKIAGNTVAVPVVDEMKCAGCGYCEFRCPVRGTAAIIVTPMAALRLSEGSYKEEGARIGLSISRKGEAAHGYGAPAGEEFEGLPPGFEE
jgi:ferredoxin